MFAQVRISNRVRDLTLSIPVPNHGARVEGLNPELFTKRVCVDRGKFEYWLRQTTHFSLKYGFLIDLA